MKLLILAIAILVVLTVMIIILLKKDEKFDFRNIPTPQEMRPKYKPPSSLPPNPVPIPLPPLPPGQDDTNFQSAAERLQRLEDSKRLSRPRRWVQTIGFKDRIQNDNERDWSNNIFGLTYDSKNDRYYTAIEDRQRLAVVSADGEALSSLLEDYPLHTDCAERRGYGSKFGQGTMHNNNIDLIMPIKNCKPYGVGPSPSREFKELGTIIEVRGGHYPAAGMIGFLPRIFADWVASDPITGFVFVPPSGSSLSTVNMYDLQPLTSRSPNWYNYQYDMRLVRTPRLYKDNLPITINGVTAACFSKNGIFYVLSNVSDTLGIHYFLLNNRGDRFNFVGFSRLERPEVSRAGLFGQDAQNFVGITTRDLGQGRNSDLIILLRNTDIGTDNFSLYRVTNVW